jgi:hypothetical protein
VAVQAALTANALGLFLIFGNFFLTAQYLQLVLGLSPPTGFRHTSASRCSPPPAAPSPKACA